ncbi:mechanosensitive ion channel [Candidatus Peribacteria bacterium]|nr:mechanosensitive ion channel [Candidatus Peribacteria bacterium]
MKALRLLPVGLLLVTSVAFAATAQDQKADPALRQLFLTQLQAKTPDEALDKHIETERLRVRKAELAELNALVASANAEDDETAQPATVLQKQSALVEILLARKQETTVDIDLLGEDGVALDQNMADAKGAALDGARRRKAELLSQNAVLEERLSATVEVLAQQEDRLQRLTAQERYANFAGVLQVAMYVAILFFIIMVERLVRRRLIVRIRDRNRRYFVVKIFTGTVYVLTIGWILYRVSGNYPGFVTSFAIVGAGIAVALQSIIKDIVGWFIIVQKRLFRIGQRVTIGGFTGDVADISLLRTTLVEVNNSIAPDIARVGQPLYLPNSMVLEGPVLNYHATSDFMEAEIPVTVTFSSDWKKAEQILQNILRDEVGKYVERAREQHAYRTAHFFASQEPPEPRVFVELASDGVFFLLRFQIPIGSKRSIISSIARKILEQFSSSTPKIDLAYKTMQLVQ